MSDYINSTVQFRSPLDHSAIVTSAIRQTVCFPNDNSIVPPSSDTTVHTQVKVETNAGSINVGIRVSILTPYSQL